MGFIERPFLYFSLGILRAGGALQPPFPRGGTTTTGPTLADTTGRLLAAICHLWIVMNFQVWVT